MKLVELPKSWACKQQLVQFFKNYQGQGNESQKYVKFMSCIFELMEKDLTRERSNMQFCNPET